MKHEKQPAKSDRPPLRTFFVRILDAEGKHEDVQLSAHLVFNNDSRGEGLVFRRYYDDSVRTEMVACFQPGHWLNYRDITA